MAIDRSSLPSNVRRWLDRSLPEDALLPNRIRNTQQGEMEIRGKWTPFTATTIDQACPFSFAWRARFKMLPGVWLIAEDGHDSERGGGAAKLWGILPMGSRQDSEAFSMQLVRSLAELPWKPQFALMVPSLKWNDTGSTRFEVHTVVEGQDISVSFELDSEGDIVGASSRRYYDIPDGYIEAPWRYMFSDHQDYDGIRLPTSAVATYDRSDGPWEYWRARLVSVVPEH